MFGGEMEREKERRPREMREREDFYWKGNDLNRLSNILNPYLWSSLSLMCEDDDFDDHRHHRRMLLLLEEWVDDFTLLPWLMITIS